MATLPYQPQNLTAEQTDGNILLLWNGSLGATSYQVQRSTDGVNFTNLSTPTVNQYIDSYPGVGIKFYYQVAGINTAGTSPYSSAVSMVAAPPSEMSLGELRLRSQQTADRVNSAFVTNSEWNAFIRIAMYELYDILITAYEDYNIAPPAYINTNGTTFQYALPDGATNYLGGTLGGSSGSPAAAFYKLSGIDLGVNTSNNAWVTLHSYNWIDRNQYVYPNSTSTIYGVYNMRYRLLGNSLNLIPVPAGNQQLRMWYAPRLTGLLADTDLTTIGFSGWLRYAIVRAAKYALDKEEGSDTSKLDAELLFLNNRITQSSASRDQGQADTISNTRRDPVFGGFSNDGGANGGWLVAPLGLFPILSSHDIRNHCLAHSEIFSQTRLAYVLIFIVISYFIYLFNRKFCSGILFSGIRNSSSSKISRSSLFNFISHIIKRGPKK